MFPVEKNRTCSTLIKLCQILRILIISNKVSGLKASRVEEIQPPQTHNTNHWTKYFRKSMKCKIKYLWN